MSRPAEFRAAMQVQIAEDILAAAWREAENARSAGADQEDS